MTQYNEVGRIGCVAITEVKAEFLDTPVTYMLDCDYSAKCQWGLPAVRPHSEAERFAQQHVDFHAEYGTESAEWPKTFG
jgi:hypothetical protein